MTMRLVCDHCEGVINDSEFREVRSSRMTRDPADPMSGTARVQEETDHFHTLCFESRLRAASQAPLASSPPPQQLPDDHPLAQLERQSAQANAERVRTGATVDRENAIDSRATLQEMTVDELQELARDREIEGRSDMKKAELIDALLAEGT